MNETGFTAIFLGMAAIVVFGLAVGVGTTIYFVSSSGRKKAAKRAFPPARIELLKRVAGEIGGDVIDRPDLYRVPFVRATMAGVRFAVVLMATEDAADGPYIVQLEVPIAGQSFVEAWPVGSPFQPQRVTTGLPEVKLGDPAFDPAYLVRADDAAHARSVLTREMRMALASMRSVGRGGLVRFNLHPQKAVFQKEEQLDDPVPLREIVRLALGAVANLKESLETQKGMEFFDDAPKRAVKVQCPICGSAIEKAKVACRRCGTPHHEECWKYFGACSMYACGEKGYELA